MTSFVGREREVLVLEQALSDAFAADARLVVLTGEPGIGKTRLAEELARRAEARGFTVVWGRSWEGEGTPAYFPWRQALRALAYKTGTAFALAQAEQPEVGTLLSVEPAASGGADPGEARFRLFDALAELLRALSAEQPLVVVLEDLHAADLSSLELLQFVSRQLRGAARVLLLATLRDAATRPSSAHQQLFAQITREATTLALGRLGREALARWLSEVSEAATGVDRVLAISEGNPLFVSELLASAAQGPDRAWSSALELPLGIREVVRSHLALLSPATKAALAAAAVLGREFTQTALAALVGDTRAELEEAISSGILLRVVGDNATSEFTLRFTHVLMRDELYVSFTPEHRAQLHRSVAMQSADPALAAPHWLSGARAADAALVERAVLAAMNDAQARFAFEDAALLGERALGTDVLAPSATCELLVRVSETWNLAGKSEPARLAGGRAAQQAAQLGDATLLSRAALAYATELSVGRRDIAAVGWLRQALAALPEGDSRPRAQVMARLSLALLPAEAGDLDDALQSARESLAMARRLGDDETLFAVLRFTRTTPNEVDDAKTRFGLNAETVELAQKLGLVPLIAPLLSWQVAAHIELGDIDAAVREADSMERLLSDYRQPRYQFRSQLVRAMLANLEGRFAEADALSSAALKLCQDHGIVGGVALSLTQRIGFLYTRGDDDGWAELEPVVLGFFGNEPAFAIYRCMFDALCGRTELVRQALTQARQLPLAALPDGAGLAQACAVAGVTEHALAFYDFLNSEARKGPWQFGPGRVTSSGPRALGLGRLARLLGREREAAGHFADALALAERLRLRPFVAQAQLELALLLAESDTAQARMRAGQALALATEMGMRRVAQHAQTLLDSVGQSASASTANAEVPTTNSLTLVQEGETWRLMGLGRSLVLKDTKGLSYLAALVGSPCRELHVLELAGLRDEGDAGPLLDERAKRQYRSRVAALREELDEATRNADLGRAARLQSELDALANELSRAFGLGGRERRAVSAAERARINVQRRLRDAIGRVRSLEPQLGQHLDLSVRTGLFCVYLPAWPPKST